MQKAPSFSLKDQNGKEHKLSDYKDRWVVLYFYPKDDTPGCTKQACGIRDERESIAQIGDAVVIGVSKDSVESHAKFAEKYELDFPLLSDPNHATIEAYGSWRPKKFMGKEYLGTNRDTFIIDPKGNIAKEYRGVDPKKHAVTIINDLKELKLSFKG